MASAPLLYRSTLVPPPSFSSSVASPSLVVGISEMAGFNTRQSFYANFFKRIGVTPRQYRTSDRS